ncbi:hypothetical protein [Azospirillum sp. BE72]|uniref:hypothetical protein n=1 Tax=Azospirillum sp. BE72 TaxID=2817776 RepID=UPI0028557921|nr:hypothetical protein [Azospirillum sp. BE72]MDR6772320.1 hypothetical protein [Azospirillum sp. BE72]
MSRLLTLSLTLATLAAAPAFAATPTMSYTRATTLGPIILQPSPGIPKPPPCLTCGTRVLPGITPGPAYGGDRALNPQPLPPKAIFR